MIDARNEVTKLIKTWSDAELHANIKSLEKILSNDYIAVGPLGFLLTKDAWIKRHEAEELKYNAFTVDEISIRIHGDMAVAIGRGEQNGTYQNHPIPEQMRITLIFVKNDNTWLIIGQHISIIGQLPLMKK